VPGHPRACLLTLTCHVPRHSQKKASKLPVGPVMLGFFLFVVVGSRV
jgi:hypothetical protein